MKVTVLAEGSILYFNFSSGYLRYGDVYRRGSDSCWTLELMKATVLAEGSYSIYFHRDFTAPVMYTDKSQVGVILFHSF